MNQAWKKFGGSAVSRLMRGTRHRGPQMSAYTAAAAAATAVSSSLHSSSQQTGTRDGGSTSGSAATSHPQAGEVAAIAATAAEPDGSVAMNSTKSLAGNQSSTSGPVRRPAIVVRKARQKMPETSDEDDDDIQEISYDDMDWDAYRSPKRKPVPRNTNMTDIFPVRLPCLQCVRTYANSKTLERHVKIAHAPEAEPMKCDNCNKVFVSKKHFTTHMRVKRCKRPRTPVQRTPAAKKVPKPQSKFARYQSPRPAAFKPCPGPIWTRNPVAKKKYNLLETSDEESDSNTSSQFEPPREPLKYYTIPKKPAVKKEPLDEAGPCSPGGLAGSSRSQNAACGGTSTSQHRPTGRPSVPFSKRPMVEPPGLYVQLFDCYFCGDELTPSQASQRPSLADAMEHYKHSGECFWKALRTAELGKDDKLDKVIKVEQNDFVDAGLILEYRRCTVCQKAFANEVPALVRHASMHPPAAKK